MTQASAESESPKHLGRRIIINADDFGLDAQTNERIISCFEDGLISSASIMANGPGYAEALRWAKGAGRQYALGLHLTLDTFSGLSDTFRALQKTAGMQCMGSAVYCSSYTMKAIADEVEAQISMLQANVPIAHIDSHHHIHTRVPVLMNVLKSAKAHGILRVRLARNTKPSGSIAKEAYKTLVNILIRNKASRKISHFGKLSDALACGLPKAGGVELMVHPGVDADMQMLRSNRYLGFMNAFRDHFVEQT